MSRNFLQFPEYFAVTSKAVLWWGLLDESLRAQRSNLRAVSVGDTQGINCHAPAGLAMTRAQIVCGRLASGAWLRFGGYPIPLRVGHFRERTFLRYDGWSKPPQFPQGMAGPECGGFWFVRSGLFGFCFLCVKPAFFGEKRRFVPRVEKREISIKDRSSERG